MPLNLESSAVPASASSFALPSSTFRRSPRPYLTAYSFSRFLRISSAFFEGRLLFLSQLC